MKCTICFKEFEKPISMANHRRWHDLPKYKTFQKLYKKQASEFNLGSKNGKWGGDNIGYGAIHDYIKNHKRKPKRCNSCNRVKYLDLANISQKYKRDLDDWEWLCRSCHMKKDGRIINNLKQYQVKHH